MGDNSKQRIPMQIPILGRAASPPHVTLDFVDSVADKPSYCLPAMPLVMTEQPSPNQVVMHVIGGLTKLEHAVIQLVAGANYPSVEMAIVVAREILERCQACNVKSEPQADGH